MTGEEFLAYVHWITRTNSATFPTSEIILSGNVQLETISRAIMGGEEDTLVLPMTTNLISGLREYPFVSDILSRVKYVEAKFDGTNWVKMDEFDLNQYGRPTSETDILSRFTNEVGSAKFDIGRKSITIYSGAIDDVSAGLKVWCNTYPAKLDASRLADATTDLSVDPTTTTHGFPRELHELWSRAISIDYKSSREKPIPLTEKEQQYDVDLAKAIWDLKHGNMDRVVVGELPPASDRGNNGFDY